MIEQNELLLAEKYKKLENELALKNRELEIQAALERVRASTMAMLTSEEIGKIIYQLFSELKNLGIVHHLAQIITDFELNKNWFNTWYASDEKEYAHFLRYNFFDHPFNEKWKNALKNGISFYNDSYSKKEKDAWFDGLFRGSDLSFVSEERKKMLYQTPGLTRIVSLDKNSSISLMKYSNDEFSEEDKNIVVRFGNLFEQSYTRFLDLKKAEEQAREAQIEVALERVRSRSMGMYKSDELQEVVTLVFEQFHQLGIKIDSSLINIFEDDSRDFNMWISDGKGSYVQKIHIPYFNHPVFNSAFDAKAKGTDFVTKIFNKEETHSFISKMVELPDFRDVPEDRKKYLLSVPGFSRSLAIGKYTAISITNYDITRPFSDIENDILRRIAKVFEQTYTRFLDLQKAEAQAREAQIETALEKVRSRSLAMHKSDELQEVINAVHDRLVELEVKMDSTNFLILTENRRNIDIWLSAPGHVYSTCISVPEIDYSPTKDFFEARERGIDFFSFSCTFEEKNRWFNYAFENTGLGQSPPERKDLMLKSKCWTTAWAISKYSALQLNSFSRESFSDSEHEILRRFGKVFEQAYIRFLDLQKAEAQAREAQIETALEKVRSRSLAMHKSDELQEVITTVLHRLNELGIAMDSAVVCLPSEEKKEIGIWIASKDYMYSEGFRVPFGLKSIIGNDIENVCCGENDYFAKQYTKEEKDAYYTDIFEHSDFRHISQARKDFLMSGGRYGLSAAVSKNSAIFTISYSGKILNESELEVLKRFSRVFEQAYIRFLDLQKAEQQAREAQIETALEKVRSRSLAMHKSDELQEVITTVLHRLNELGIAMDSASISLPSQEKQEFMVWIASKNHDYSEGFRLPFGLKSVIARDYENLLSAETDHFFQQYSKEEKDDYYRELFEYSDFRHIPQARKDFLMSGGRFGASVTVGKYSTISALSYSGNILNSEEIEVLKRFLRVFEQAYIRFLDLQKAEAQAREAQIETALERVRSRTMGMQKSEELAEVIAQINAEITSLGIRSDNTAIMTEINLTEISGSICMWFSIPGKTYSNKFYLPVIQHPTFTRLNEALKKKIEFYTEIYSKEEKNKYLKIAFEETDLKLLPDERKEVLLNAPAWTKTSILQKNSGLVLQRFRDEAFSDEENAVAIRFGRVFEQTYTRFLDLQKAEQQLREAVKQASLDRVRGEIASMRTKDDLDRITPLIWKELIALGVPFIRCGVFIMDEKHNEIHTYLSTPDGHAIAAFHTPLDDSGPLNDAIDHWRKQKKYMAHWVEKDFSLQADILVLHGAITSREQYLNSIPKVGFYLHFSPFLQGMIYVGSMVSLQPDDFQMVQLLADAFSVAYARYEDFKQLEEAKLQTEKTLNELKDTQKQLIQSEKMASLGELTAGIAHEIQNPLNFVNNFSEVSNELIDEMREELAVGNNQLANEIANDIKQNLEKINHHGKRAADIVKGMLQHSRTSSGVKEPTDINALADEYLRLAYHGLRAKDKSFNADFVTEFDESLPKINVIPQDIGRVLLNLINNAFYAVNERAKLLTPPPPEGGSKNDQIKYVPTVTISTAFQNPPSGGRGVRITVKDNGSGIPAHIVDKIFQPFFTTKPTGQGTGLGLSLSYDIVKAHGGELRVETKEGVGSEFIIQLLIN